MDVAPRLDGRAKQTVVKLKRTPKWAGDRIRREQIEHQRRANASGRPHGDLFAGHRSRTTELVLESGGAGFGRVCVLGAGNCLDLDLARVARAFQEVHLVDIDRGAVEWAHAKLDDELQERVFVHAPVDLSGVLSSLDRWQRGGATETEFLELPDKASQLICSEIPGTFDVVLSSCVLTQLQLALLNALTDRHHLFEAARLVVSLVHLRTLARLAAKGGRALLVLDLTSNKMAPIRNVPENSDIKALMDDLVARGQVIYVSHPDTLLSAVREDPMLERALVPQPITRAWLWQNGPDHVLLVYALEFARTTADAF